MRDLLVSLSVGTLIPSVMCVILVLMLKFSMKDDDKELSEFKWGMVAACISFFISCLLYLLWDFDVIEKRTQYDLSIISRSFMFASVILFFRTLSLRIEEKLRDIVVMGSIILMILVFIIRVCLF